MAIFSDRDEAEVIKHLAGDNAQAFVDAVGEVSIHILSTLESESTKFH